MVFTIRMMNKEDLSPVIQLVTQVFNQFEAPEYSSEGVGNFLRYIDVEAFRKRMNNNHFALVAQVGETIVGVMEVRNNDHICLLFVDATYHQQGIGKTLLRVAIARSIKNSPKITEITVNSSLFAVPIYQRLGFIAIGGEKVQDGIRFIPMTLLLRRNTKSSFSL